MATDSEAVLDGALDLLGAEFSIVMEPTDGELQLDVRGTINATVEFHGTAAHSARPWLGENRGHQGRGGWRRCTSGSGAMSSSPDSRSRRPSPSPPLTAGSPAIVIPATFSLNLNHRFPPDRTMEEAEAEVLAVCAGADQVEIVDRAAAGAIPEGNAHLDVCAALVDIVAAKRRGPTSPASPPAASCGQLWSRRHRPGPPRRRSAR